MKRITVIKLGHTIVRIFFNVVLFYLYYAAIIDKIGKWVWIGIGEFALEGMLLLLFKMVCPFTLLARKYSDSQASNFDIFLPGWLASNNKIIYTILLSGAMILTLFRLLQWPSIRTHSSIS